MNALDKVKAAFSRPTQSDIVIGAPAVTPAVTTKAPSEHNIDEENGFAKPDQDGQSETVTENAQHGVQTVEATTLAWNKGTLAAVFILMWLIYLTNGFQSRVTGTLQPFAVSEWESHSLIPVIGVVASSINAAVFIPLSKVLDLWGRAEGFLLMVVVATVGMAMMAGSHSLPTYCVAYVFWQVGWTGLIYSIDVITADATKLKNRGLAYAFTSSAYMVTAFAGPKAAEEFLYHVDWRWGFGAFTILLPVIAAPLYLMFRWNLNKAEKKGILVRQPSGRTWLEGIRWGLVEFDAAGAFLFAAGLVVFLLPFSIAGDAPHGWETGYIIAMIIVGAVLLVLFGLHEKYLAPTPFFKAQFLVDRTVLGVCLLDLIYQISYYCWGSYFTSFLQVVNDLHPSEANWISNTFDIISGVLLFIVGYGIRGTGYFKWLLVAGVPLYILFQGLMIHFRQPGQSVGYLIMCEVFISIAGAAFILCMQVGILASVDHQHVATALAMLSVVGSTGGAIGGTVSAAIWTNTFYTRLAQLLPAESVDDVDMIYADLETQLSYPVGSETRTAIQQAYGYGQARMLAAGTGIMAIALLSLLLIRNYDLRKLRQTKGVVF